MANVLHDPRIHSDPFISDLASNEAARFAPDKVAFVYGSLWKQRYFTKIDDDFYPCRRNGTSLLTNGWPIWFLRRVEIGGETLSSR